jgi:glycosyltransferase involved in cell wall biosynthesis
LVFCESARAAARWENHKFLPDLVYSPGINAPDVDVITVHITFCAFYEQVREQLRLGKQSPLRWPRTLHRILYYRLIMALERKIYSNRRIALSAVSNLVAAQLRRFFGREDVVVIRNAVDTGQFNSSKRLAKRPDARAKFGFASDESVFLLIGNDWKKKGLDALLEALARCEDLPLRLLVVGSDSQQGYKDECARLGIGERVLFHPPSSDVLQFYAAADAYVGPSLEDAFGLPVLESMACGLPVIASRMACVS